MKIKELEDCLRFMSTIGFSESYGAKVLSKYFLCRSNGRSAEEAASLVFDEFDSKANKSVDLAAQIKAFHLRLCKIGGFKPDEVSAAMEDFYKLNE